jgi:hypothetical protein
VHITLLQQIAADGFTSTALEEDVIRHDDATTTAASTTTPAPTNPSSHIANTTRPNNQTN